jgi:hypothetical protein
MDDLISRQAAIEYFKRIIDATNTDGRYNLGFIDGLEFCINHLSTMPSIQSEQKKGKWYLRDTARYGKLPYICTVCGREANDIYDFCPNCGAKME